MSKPVSCSRCDQEWPRDPALEVDCPSCPAKIGQKCRRGSQHTVWGGQPHATRDRLAMDSGVMEKCTGVLHQKTEVVEKELIRQAQFRVDGSVTSVPARDSERPQLEQQVSMF